MLNIPEYKNAARVFHYFEQISKIPHGSGNTAPIADYLVGFAKEHSLDFVRDGKDNVLIRKAAAKGYEDRPTVIIQGHTDMVAEKTADSTRDMLREGIEIYRDGDFLRAKDTTLGGDDGIAVAYALALLEGSDIPHPAIEALFTSDEEIGLLGADAFDKSLLRGRMMINIDTDEEGVFVAGCAGGVRTDIELPVRREGLCGRKLKLSVSGLMGGHSGAEIDRGRANAIKLGFLLLDSMGEVRLASAFGGNMDNAIPREFTAEIIISEDAYNAATESYEELRAKLRKEYASAEPDMEISLSPAEFDTVPCDAKSSADIIATVNAVPFGPQAMNEEIEGLVETSLNSGIVRLDSSFKLCTSIRSSKESEKDALTERLRKIAVAVGADFSTRGAYPGWAYRKSSPLRSVCERVYKRMYGKDAKVITIHAGLECGLFTGAIPELDCISMGPENHDIHTTEEHLSISSSARVWEYLLAVLKEI